MLLSHDQLLQLVDDGAITARSDQVNASSIDLTLGPVLLVESEPKWAEVVDLGKSESISLHRIEIPENGYRLRPGHFVLAQTAESFHLPRDISAEYKLNSTLARNGLDHLNAGWADAGFNGSVLTLEFKNVTQKHQLVLRAGMRCGQMVFFRHPPVPESRSYAVRGRYNGQKEVCGAVRREVAKC